MSSADVDGRAKQGGRFAVPAPPLWAVAAVGAAVLVVHLVWPVGPTGDGTYLAALIGAAVLAWLMVAGCGARDRRAWALVATGISISATADLIWTIDYWITDVEPDVSIADPLWLLSYVALALGLMRLTPGRTGARGVDVDAIIDSLVPAVLALVALWELAIADLISDQASSLLARLVWAAYPICDVVLLTLAVRLAIHHHRTRSRALTLFGAGVAAWLAADVGYLLVTAEGLYRWLDAGWMVASLLMAAAVVAHRRDGGDDLAEEVPGVHRGRMWLVMVPLLVPPALEVQGHLEGADGSSVALAAATIALVALASLRGHRLLRAAERARSTLEVGEAHFRALAANSADAVLVVGADGRVSETSGNLLRLTGREAGDVVGEPVSDALSCIDRDALETYVATVRQGTGAVSEHEVEVRHADGEPRWLAARLVSLLDDPAVGGVVVNLQDVTERRRAQDELAHQAFHDGLTGLANHGLFGDRIEHALRRSARTGAAAAVLYLDIDGFKSVNDRFGHDAGNHVIQEVADRLRGTVRAADTVARLGGDEFAVLIDENHLHADEARTTAERILQALSIPVDVDGQLIAISASIGLAVGDASCTASALLRNADIAMYQAKAGGKARTVVYDEQMGAAAGDALRVESDLVGVIERGELELHYQPVLQLETRRLTGFEALVRWRHPELGLLSPDRFVPLSEDTGQIVPIGRWVLHTACAAATRWRDAGDCPPPLTMAVNLSAVQLATDQIVDDVRAALATSGLDPSLLVLEMTETSLITDPGAAAGRLRALHDLGVRLAIDDFGTGYSSLSYLRQFPIDILKIDRSFVDTITDGDDIPPIVRGLIDLGRTLDLEIIAEGIESDAQHEGLRREECEMGQGFLFARPMPAGAMDRLLAERTRRADAMHAPMVPTATAAAPVPAADEEAGTGVGPR